MSSLKGTFLGVGMVLYGTLPYHSDASESLRFSLWACISCGSLWLLHTRRETKTCPRYNGLTAPFSSLPRILLRLMSHALPCEKTKNTADIRGREPLHCHSMAILYQPYLRLFCCRVLLNCSRKLRIVSALVRERCGAAGAGACWRNENPCDGRCGGPPPRPPYGGGPRGGCCCW